MRLQQVLCVSVITLSIVNDSHADVFSSHSLLDARAGAPPAAFATIESEFPADTGFIFKDDSVTDNNGIPTIRVDAAARARTSPSALSLLHGSARAYNENSTMLVTGRSTAYAAWRDIVFVDASSPPDYVTLHFDVDARIFGHGWSSAVGFSVVAGSQADFGGLQAGSIELFGAGYDLTEPREPFFDIVGFDTVEQIDGTFYATFHRDVPYDPEVGGFPWSVSLQLKADALGGSPAPDVTTVSINTVRGVRLTQVSDIDGNPLSVAFDSGLTFDEPLLGDFDYDGDIDGRDFLEWQRDPSSGDLADWQANYGAGSLVTTTSVPEPSSLLLSVVIVGLATITRLKRQSPSLTL
jgi:hypothetical protein